MISSSGSSPLARGTLLPAPASRPLGRFIPARAGNTRPRQPSPPPAPVHPRSRGEHSGAATMAGSRIGSSPLARGTPARSRRVGIARRFIPARAGNTRRRRRAERRAAVHPRSRGEHSAGAGVAVAVSGSSPLARGTRCAGLRSGDRTRFIPARAGNTSGAASRSVSLPVHPRSRGEHAPGAGGIEGTGGSSPLARGTRTLLGMRRKSRRFIPARAGNTPRRSRSTPCCPVHPRSRGEHDRRRPRHRLAAGSSPLARGTPDLDREPRRRLRFIPARAGNTARRCRAAPPGPVHPPLARGTRVEQCVDARPQRFIPARAGNTHT